MEKVQFGDPDRFWLWPDDELDLSELGAPSPLYGNECEWDEKDNMDEGSTRRVYALGGHFVLKMGERRINQCEAVMWQYVRNTEYAPYFAKVVHAAADGSWLIMERLHTFDEYLRTADHPIIDIANKCTVYDVFYKNVATRTEGDEENLVLIDYAAWQYWDKHPDLV